MSATLSLTEAQTLAALRTVLIGLLPAGIEIIRAEGNRIPEPRGADFVVMTPMRRERLSTNIATWSDGALLAPQVPGTRSDMQPSKVSVQLDIHGPLSADTTQIITTLFRSDVMFNAFAFTGVAVQALYADEAHQAPFINAEQQVEYRWVCDVTLQANPAVTSPQDFAQTVTLSQPGGSAEALA
jgi:hypothetical protein